MKRSFSLAPALVNQLKDSGTGGASPSPTLMELKFIPNPMELRYENGALTFKGRTKPEVYVSGAKSENPGVFKPDGTDHW
jgi:hypothetical protein